MAGTARFPTTRWTLVIEAAGPDARRSVLGELCAAYWSPVYAFIKRRTRDPEQAKDLTQAFFARVLEKHDLPTARLEGARFRSFLLASVKHFLSNEWDAERAQKRGRGQEALPLDAGDIDDGLCEGIVDTLTPENIFERRWATLMLDRALGVLRREFEAAGQGRRYEALKTCVTGDRPDATYREIGAALRMSEGAVKVAVHRMRRRYGELLREQIAQTVADPGDVEDELRYLFSVMST